MTPAALVTSLPAAPALSAFWNMDQAARDQSLLRGIMAAHTYHFERNTAYRSTVSVRGVGPYVGQMELPRLLRATSQTFKSYIDVLETPFPHDRPADFLEWLAEQVSIDMRPEKHRLRSWYGSMEGLLRAIEREYSKLGLELLVSSGATGRTTVIPRDRKSTELNVQSFHLAFDRYFRMKADHSAVFMIPKRTRIAVPRVTRSSVQRVGLARGRMHFVAALAGSPDQVRVRVGRTYRPGLKGAVERHIWHPVMTALQARILDAQAVEAAVSRLVPAAAHGQKVVLFGGLKQVHDVARFLLDRGRTIELPPGSVLGTAGGLKGPCPTTAAEMRYDLQQAFRLPSGEPAPIRDVYGMAEANWAAIQCGCGNYHLPPWVHVVTLDDQDLIQTRPRSTGLLAFFDPYGGGELFPAFFRTADRVTLVRGMACPCGEPGSYLEEGSIHRLDLPGEAACAGRI